VNQANLPVVAPIPELSAGRPDPTDRRFSSAAIEAAIAGMKRRITDPVLAAMFEQCFPPNTLDTAVFAETFEGKPDTSSAQVLPYLQFAKQDPSLAALLEGVIRRQARMVLIDP
jgi:hypothetical protein